MHYYIPLRTNDGTVIVRSSENACVSVCCIFSSDGNLEIARFDNFKIAQSACTTWNDEQFQNHKPFLFHMTYSIFICPEDFLKREAYDLNSQIFQLIDERTANEIQRIRCGFLNLIPMLFLRQSGIIHPSLIAEIALTN